MDKDAVITEAVSALVHGPGYYVVPDVLNPTPFVELNAIINEHTKNDNEVCATHFHGSEYNQKKLHLQKRVWNLLNKGSIFSELVQHPIMMKVFSKILGKNFILGSFAANKLLPGAPRQDVTNALVYSYNVSRICDCATHTRIEYQKPSCSCTTCGNVRIIPDSHSGGLAGIPGSSRNMQDASS